MKKSKILIPALSIASVGAVVAPMVTSCAKANSITFTIDETTTEYKTMFTPVDRQFETENELIETYNNEVNGNGNILNDDIIFTYFNDKKSNAENGSITVADSSIKTVYFDGGITSLVSTRMVISYITDTYDTTMEYTITNMPYTMVQQMSSTVLTPGLIPCAEYVLNTAGSYDPEDVALATLAMLMSGFTTTFSLNVYDKDLKAIETNVNIEIVDIATLQLLYSNDKTKSYLNPLTLSIQSNYFSKASVK